MRRAMEEADNRDSSHRMYEKKAGPYLLLISLFLYFQRSSTPFSRFICLRCLLQKQRLSNDKKESDITRISKENSPLICFPVLNYFGFPNTEYLANKCSKLLPDSSCNSISEKIPKQILSHARSLCTLSLKAAGSKSTR